jgi:regulator of nucleoside diphosphate kinase
MNAYISTMIVFASYLGGVLLVLFIGRLITRTEVYRRWAGKRGKPYPRSRIIEDLRPVQETMIDFVDASPPSRELLQQLAETDEPIHVRELLAAVSREESSWTALFLIAAAGLVSFGRKGVSLTDVGREVLAQITRGATEVGHGRADCKPAVAKSNPTTEGKNGSQSTSHLQIIQEAFDTSKDPESESALAVRGFPIAELRPQPHECLRTAAQGNARAVLTAADHRELTAAIVAAKKLAAYDGETQPLQEKLAHAEISPAGQVPPDVITMYSRAELVDVDTDERLSLMLVFPIDADFEHGRVSVFKPLGAAMLGRRIGDQLRWNVPYRVRRLEVKAVHFQPETALAEAA